MTKILTTGNFLKIAVEKLNYVTPDFVLKYIEKRSQIDLIIQNPPYNTNVSCPKS